MDHEWITIAGAREHNLKNITVTLPRHRTVITGLSGSGKSSLAFDEDLIVPNRELSIEKGAIHWRPVS